MKVDYLLVRAAMLYTGGIMAAGTTGLLGKRIGVKIWCVAFICSVLLSRSFVGSRVSRAGKSFLITFGLVCLGGWAADMQWEKWQAGVDWLTDNPDIEVVGQLTESAGKLVIRPESVCTDSTKRECISRTLLAGLTWVQIGDKSQIPTLPCVVWARGRYRVPVRAGNPGGFDPMLDAIRKGNMGSLYIEEWHAGFSQTKSIKHWRHQWQTTISEAIPGEPGALVNSLVLGGTTFLSPETKLALQKAGLSHVMSVSGLHVSLVAGFIWIILRGSNGIRGWLGIMTVLSFILVTEGRPPAFRALIALVLASMAKTLGRESQAWNSLAAAWLFLTAWNPALATDIGCQLSFACVAGILAIGRPLLHTVPLGSVWIRASTYIWNMLAISCAAQLGAAYLTVQTFNVWPIYAPITNLIGVPLTLIILLGGLSGSFFAMLGQIPIAIPMVQVVLTGSEWISRGVLQFTGWCARVFLSLCYVTAGAPAATVEVPALPWLAGPTWVMVLGFISYQLQIRHLPSILKPIPSRTAWRLLIVAVAGVLVCILITLPNAWMLRVTFFDVGQGDSILVLAPGGYSVLVDAGGIGKGWDASRAILPQLAKRGVKKLTAVISTHVHADHLGGMAGVLQAKSVGLALESGTVASTNVYSDYRRLLRERRVPVFAAKHGDVLHLGKVQLQVIWPPEQMVTDPTTGTNYESLIIRVSMGDVAVLLMGDAPAVVQRSLLQNDVAPAVLWKVPHQGAVDSLNTEFVARVSPRVSVISVGPNQYGHPNPTVVRTLSGQSTICRTDKHGAIEFRTNGKRWSVVGTLGKECRASGVVLKAH